MELMKGDKFGRWTVIKYSHKDGPHHFWVVKCKCGKVRKVQQGSLTNFRSTSCGCYRSEAVRKAQTTHGMSASKLHGIWTRMKQRCENPRAANYKYYGGREISVCYRWRKFENFLADMGNTYKPGLTLERIDNNNNYLPFNCRWATKKEQAQNRRNSVLIDTKWGKITLAEVAERIGADRRTLAYHFANNLKDS